MNPQDALIVAHRLEDTHPLTGILARYPLRSIQVAHSAEQALAMMEESQPELLFVDLVLPGSMDGWELMYELRKAKEFHDRLVIALTAYDHEGVQEAALAEGFTAYFTTPLDESRFVPVLEHLASFS